MKEKSMCQKYMDREITWTEYNNWLIQKKAKNIKSMYRRWQDNEISYVEYFNWLKQKKGFKDYSEYQKQYQQLNKEHRKRYYQNNKQYISKYKKQYVKTESGKIAKNKSQSKRERELGYNVVNPQDSNKSGYIGHHLSLDDVMFIPEQLHKSIWHKQSNKKSMQQINSDVINWYLKHIGFIFK